VESGKDMSAWARREAQRFRVLGFSIGNHNFEFRACGVGYMVSD
jgi:hypothetical protein